MLDAIPLKEIIGVESMVEICEKESYQGQPQNEFDKAMDFTSAFQIRTQKHGYNAGRKYFLRADSDTERDELIKQLLVLTKNAIARAETATQWERMQSRVRVIYNSSLFQGVAAFLIIAVSASARKRREKRSTHSPVPPGFRSRPFPHLFPMFLPFPHVSRNFLSS
jgi:hypothetical protein